MEQISCFHDFGRAAYGSLEVAISGTPGEKVNIAIGEVAKDGKIDRAPGGYRCFKEADIILDKAYGTYRFDIPRHQKPSFVKNNVCSPLKEEVTCFRYAEVTGNCRVLDFKRSELFPRWDEDAAHFECSNARLNRLWEFCKYSIKVTGAFGIFIDGERERCPYEGDAYINQLCWFCCSSDPDIPRRTLDFFMENRTWPMEWSLIIPMLVRDYLYYTGDTASVQRYLPMVKARLLDEYRRPDGLLCSADDCLELIDWPPAERDNYESRGCSLVPNCYRYAALLTAAELTGDMKYAAEAEQLKSVIYRTMFNGREFTDSPASEHVAAHSRFFPVAMGIIPAAQMPQLSQLAMVCSVYGAQFLLDALYMGNFAREAMALLTDDSIRSWNNMMRCGSTVSMEAWDDSFKPNQDWNHAWGAAPANLIPRRLCGIRPAAPGFAKFIVDPQPADLKSFSLTQPTLHGAVRMEYDGGTVTVDFPRGTTALFRNREYKEKFSCKLQNH